MVEIPISNGNRSEMNQPVTTTEQVVNLERESFSMENGQEEGSNSVASESVESRPARFHPQDKRGRFLPGNTGRPKGIPNKQAKARAMLMGEAEDLMRTAIEMAKKNPSLMKEVLRLLVPANKSQLEATEIPGFHPDLPLEAKSKLITDAAMSGLISADVATSLVTSLERSEQAQRLKSLNDRVAELSDRVLDGRGLVRRVN